MLSMRNIVHRVFGFALTAVWITLMPAGFAQSHDSMPDILGLRPGMSIGDAYRVLKAHDPRGSITYGQKRIDAVSDKVITHAFLYSANGSDQDPEIIVVDITLPPSQQTVWRVTRYLRFEQGKEPLPETLLTALRQKYGQEVGASADIIRWVIDPRGGPAAGSRVKLNDCAMYVENPNVPSEMGVAPQNIPAGVALNPTTVAANRDDCHGAVYVVATMSRASNLSLVGAISVTVTDIGAGIRAGQATVAVMNRAATDQQQRVLKNAQKQGAPSF